jgi:hypothetical protein
MNMYAMQKELSAQIQWKTSQNNAQNLYSNGLDKVKTPHNKRNDAHTWKVYLKSVIIYSQPPAIKL